MTLRAPLRRDRSVRRHRGAPPSGRAGAEGLGPVAPLRRLGRPRRDRGPRLRRAAPQGIVRLDHGRRHAARGAARDAGARARSRCRRRSRKLCDGARFAPEPLSDEEHARLRAASLEGAPAHVLRRLSRMARCPACRDLRRGPGRGGRGARVARAARPARQHAEGGSREAAQEALAEFGAAADALVALAACASSCRRMRKARRSMPSPRSSKARSRSRTKARSSPPCSSGAKPGEQVIDLCAGAGGKTLALAAAMENHGQIYATDTDKRRLAPIHDRLERAGARNVQVITPRGDKDMLADLEPQGRPRADRRALHRHRRVAAQPGRQVARAARRARRAAEGSGRGARPRGRAGEAGRPHRLCHLLGARRRERRAGARLHGAPSGLLGRAAGRGRKCARRARLPVPPRGADVGRRAADDAAPHRHRRVFRERVAGAHKPQRSFVAHQRHQHSGNHVEILTQGDHRRRRQRHDRGRSRRRDGRSRAARASAPMSASSAPASRASRPPTG